ncbi:tudor domain-containing protein 1-like [Ochlerotatus camptorhynchus]|uniref:tudor domain-containing protein 1-like n=1 Tax=Ochlerotatus camptorhynchus TaxID=644619 RepID=UPI0031DF4C4B
MKKISKTAPSSVKEELHPAEFIPPPKSKKIDGKNAKHFTASSSRTVKDAEMRPPSANPENAVHLPVGSGKTTESLRTKDSRCKNSRFYHAPSRSTVSVKDKPASPNVEIIDRSQLNRDGNRHAPKSELKSQRSNSFRQQAVSDPIDPDKATFIKYSRKVDVTCVINPRQFYVRNQGFEMIVNKLCRDDAEETPIPEEVKIGSLYLAQSQSEQRWYRCRVLGRSIRTKKYQVQFVDYGHTDKVLQSRLRVLPEDMQRVEDGAYKCSLYDVIPADGSKDWTPEIHKIINDFVGNKQTMMYVIQPDTDVDLIAQTIDGPKSLREALFYMNLAKPDPNPPKRNEDASHRIDHLERVKKRWILDYRRYIPAKYLQKDDVFKTKIISSVSPNEFYICKSSWLEAYEKMKLELNDYCNKADARIAYSPHVGMVCAFAEKDRDDLLVWKRGRVFKVGKGNCKVDSVDTGHRLTVCWQDIREIPQPFCSSSEFSVRCCLMHIQPFMQNFYHWTEEAIAFFNQIARTSFVFQVIVGEQEANCYGVALYLVKRRYDICVNGLMVKNKFAVGIGVESTIVELVKEKHVEEEEPDTQGNNSTKSTVEKRVPRRAQVEILRVVSPNEFYVSLITNDSGIARMQEYIQDNMRAKTDEGDDMISWQLGEMCMVYPPTATRRESDTLDCEWYRARVLEAVADSNYKVFLIDKALTIVSHYSKMRPIVPVILKEFYPFAIRCSLACIGPTGRLVTWSPSVVDAFKVAIEKFKFFAISIHGRCVNYSIPVILWGMTVERTNALSSQLYAYTNVNNKLVQYGYAHLREKFPPLAAALSVEEELERHYQALDNFLDNLDAEAEYPTNEPSNCGLIDDYQNDITDELTPIDHWLPAKPIDKVFFVGIPTYVDISGVIYLHDAGLESTLTAIQAVIKAKSNGSQQLPGDQFYSTGEPCLAKYHLDEHFYRAVVRKALSQCRYEVQLVDYGTVEVCHVRDLRKNVICGRIPTLVNKYRLTGVVPKQAGGIWPFVAMDALHALIVDKQCQVRVDTDMATDTAGVVPCYIKTTGEFPVEVSDYLLNMFDQLLYDPFANLFESFNDSAPKSEDKSKVVPCDSDMESYFNEKELTDLLEAISATAERKEDEEENSVDGSEIDLNQMHYFYSYGDVKLRGENKVATDVSVNISFNSNEFDTSTQVDQPLETARLTFNGYLDFTLDKSIHGFYCEVTNLLGPFNMFVFPQLDEHIRLMKDTMVQIQFYAKKHGPCPGINIKMPCLAKFKQDGYWYRALVVKHFPDSEEARVLYVDYLNEETVSVRDIQKCPSSMRKVPLRNVQIKLHALQINPRLRKSDVTMKLVELIEGKRLYARVVAQNPALEVEFFTNSKCERLVYHQMIKERYFLSTK